MPARTSCRPARALHHLSVAEGLLAGIQADQEWFQLRQHQQNTRFAGGAVHIGLAVVDADCRRQLFGQRMLHMMGGARLVQPAAGRAGARQALLVGRRCCTQWQGFRSSAVHV